MIYLVIMTEVLRLGVNDKALYDDSRLGVNDKALYDDSRNCETQSIFRLKKLSLEALNSRAYWETNQRTLKSLKN